MVKELNTDDEIKEAWRKSGFLSRAKFKKYLKSNDYTFKGVDIDTFLKNQESTQITRKPQRPKEFSSVYAENIRDNYEIDIMIYDRKEINNYKYVFGCIDVRSRYCHCIPMTNKKGSTILKCFKDTFKIMGKPKNLNMDNEFKSTELVRYLKDENIKVYYSYADEAFESMKNPIIERFWRTLAQLLRTYSLNTGEKKWYLYLSRVVMNYNKTEHSSINTTPYKIWTGKDDSKELFKVTVSKFKIGDYVRIALKKTNTFTKADELGFSKDIYQIVKKDDELTNRYILKDIVTGKLTRPHLERDFLRVDKDKIQKAKIIQTREKEKDKKKAKPSAIKARKKTKKALKNLETTLKK